MTDTAKRRKLSYEILGFIALSAVVALLLYRILSGVATVVAETYCFDRDIPMTEFDWMEVDRWIFSVSAVLSCCTFSILFLCLLGDKIDYIRKITAGINALHTPEQIHLIPLEGNDELTQLAAAINHMSQVRCEIQQKEKALAREKEHLIRTLSHDIRTPLTSILAYSDYLAGQEEISPEEQKAQMKMISKKAEQIRDLTAILLDGSRRNLEYFGDGRLLMEQIAAEFQEELEEEFQVITDFFNCPAFSGTFDVQELRRIFDNLSSNIHKYADPDKPVTLIVSMQGGSLIIRQTNSVLPEKPSSESYRIGLNSIRRIAQHYGGSVAIEETPAAFSIAIILSEI